MKVSFVYHIIKKAFAYGDDKQELFKSAWNVPWSFQPAGYRFVWPQEALGI